MGSSPMGGLFYFENRGEVQQGREDNIWIRERLSFNIDRLTHARLRGQIYPHFSQSVGIKPFL